MFETFGEVGGIALCYEFFDNGFTKQGMGDNNPCPAGDERD